ncbi:MAG: hypothetical protein ACE5IH_02145 [Thermodesulfobacteriota bacterium]
MKVFAVIVILLLFFLNVVSIAFAEENGSIRELINRLNKEYIFLDEALDKLEENIRDFPDTTLNLSVIKRSTDIMLVSIEVLDSNSNRLLKNHIYTPLENKALNAGGRQQLYSGEIGKGRHRLNVIYYWMIEDAPPQKGEALITLSVSPGKNYSIELSFEKRGNKIKLRQSHSELSIK